jgi:molybdenum cofactor biosynthesis protein B
VETGVNVAVLAIAEDPASADLATVKIVADRLTAAGHRIVTREIVKDAELVIRQQLTRWIADANIDVVIATGGIESETARAALAPLVTQTLPGFVDLFRMFAYQEIGAGAMLSNAEAAQCDKTFVFVLPASVGAVNAAMEKLIVPQLDHRTKPRNLILLLQRLRASQPAIPKIPAKPVIPPIPPVKAAVPIAITTEKTTTGSGVTPKAPAKTAPRQPPPKAVSRNVRPPEDPPTKPIDVANLERQIALSALPADHDAPTRPIDLAGLLPRLPPGADEPVEADEDTDERPSQPVLLSFAKPVADPPSVPQPVTILPRAAATEAVASSQAPASPSMRAPEVISAPPPAPPRKVPTGANSTVAATPPATPAQPQRIVPISAEPAAPIVGLPPAPKPPRKPPAKTQRTRGVSRWDVADARPAVGTEELPRGQFSYPVRQRSTKKLAIVFSMLALAAAASFVAVVKLFPDREAKTTPPPASVAAMHEVPAPVPPPPVATPDADTSPPEIVIENAEALPPDAAVPEPVAAKPVKPTKPPTSAKPPVTRPPATDKPPAAAKPVVVETPVTKPKQPIADEKPPEPPPAPVAADCDEVSCVLEHYARPCCERYRPSDTGFTPRSTVPEEITRPMVVAGVQKVKPVVIACGEKNSAKGTVKLAITVAGDGHVQDVAVRETPDPALGDCVAAAIRKTTFGKSVNGGSFTYPFAF